MWLTTVPSCSTVTTYKLWMFLVLTQQGTLASKSIDPYEHGNSLQQIQLKTLYTNEYIRNVLYVQGVTKS